MEQQQQQLSNYLQGINLYNASQQSKKGDLMSMLTYYQNERQYKDSREDTAFEKQMKLVDMDQRKTDADWTKYVQGTELNQREREFITNATGMIDGNPTMATQKMLQEFGLDEAKINETIRKNNATIEQGYNNYKLNVEKHNFNVGDKTNDNNLATEKFELSNQKYYTTIQTQANTAAMKEFTMKGYGDALRIAESGGNTVEVKRLGGLLDQMIQRHIAIFSGIKPSDVNIKEVVSLRQQGRQGTQ